MIALIHFRLSTLLHSQRYLPPALLFLAVLAVGTVNSSGPLLPVYALCAGAVFISAAWLTVVLANIEGPEHRAITVISAGGSRAPLVATIAVALAGCVVLTVVGLLLPLAWGTHSPTAAELAVGVGAQLICACAGVGIGLLCSRLVITRPGYSLLTALALVMLTLLAPAIPPVNPVLRLLSSGRGPHELLWPLLGFAAVAIATLAVSAVLTQRVAARRT
ncbi:MAG: hypothetical protein L0H84_24450 [Pseudonocardia sp.]|nr:hypothetical protein [Pseudonocardia sp.]